MRSFATLFVFLFLSLSAFGFADCHCCSNVDVGFGWRRDNIKWNAHLRDCFIGVSHIDSNLFFKHVDIYTVNAKAKTMSCAYYLRGSAEYGQTYKGRLVEDFEFTNSLFPISNISTQVRNPIRRRCEVYDFSAAAGYPLSFGGCCACQGYIVPLIGYSFHRQYMRVKEHHPVFSRLAPFDAAFFGLDRIRESVLLGCSCPCVDICKRLWSHYRFTWYGPFIGVDLAYALDGCWTLFAELEAHYGKCHRKRKSQTSIKKLDDLHRVSRSYGFEGKIGTAFYLGNCWYADLAVNFTWWKSYQSSQYTQWDSIGIKANLGYTF